MQKLATAYFLSIFLFLLFPSLAYADMGPKPTADIKVTLDGKEIPDDFRARMLVCVEDPHDPYGDTNFMFDPTLQAKTTDIEDLRIPDASKKCYWINADFAWGGDCENSICRFHYFVPERFRLAVMTSDGTFFVTNEVENKNFDSTFVAELNSDGTGKIEETTSFLTKDNGLITFAGALVMTLSIELVVALFFFGSSKLKPNFVTVVLLANLLTLPALWLLFPQSTLSYLLFEIGIVFAEAIVFLHFYKNQIRKRKLLVFSFTANALSFVLGFLITGFFSLMGVNVAVIIRIVSAWLSSV